MITATRVLLVEDNEDIARLVEGLLAHVPGRRYEVAWAASLADGMRMLAASAYDVVVLDLTLPDSHGLDTFRRLRGARESVPLVILTGDEDERTALTAVAEGAEDFLTKTRWHPESLSRTLQLAIQRHNSRAARAPLRRGQIFAFLGVKGGVGATLSALNIAGALASPESPCIAVELRADRGSFAVHLAHKPRRNLSAARDLSPASVSVGAVESMLVDACPGLRILHGPQEASEFGEVPVETAAALLDAAALSAGYVVLDLGPGASALTRLGATRATFTVLVANRDVVSCEMARGMLPLLRSWGIGDACVGGIVINRGMSVDGVPAAELRSALGCEMLGVVPQDATRTPGFEKGLPLTIRKPDSFAGASLIDVARRLPAARGARA